VEEASDWKYGILLKKILSSPDCPVAGSIREWGNYKRFASKKKK
jgi:hypothetical protein